MVPHRERREWIHDWYRTKTGASRNHRQKQMRDGPKDHLYGDVGGCTGTAMTDGASGTIPRVWSACGLVVPGKSTCNP